MDSNSFKTYDITLGKVYNGTELCTASKVELIDSCDVIVNCIDEVAGTYRIQFQESDECKCLTFLVSCDECDSATSKIIKKCFCSDDTDCGPCQTCVGGVCKDLCVSGEVCIEDKGICGDCISDSDCDGIQVCNNGKCECPVGYRKDANGNCIQCSTDDECDVCESCITGKCVSKDCGGGACDPVNGDCVDCIRSSDCTGDNECCVNKECNCCPGYSKIDGVCVPTPECTFEEDCPDCFICVDGNCIAQVCPDGYICYKGTCYPECDCVDPKCTKGGCVGVGSNTCICADCASDVCTSNTDCIKGCHCEGGDCVYDPCDGNEDCPIGYYCDPDTGTCRPNPCAGSCINGSGCTGGALGCGCYNGNCYPCESLSCTEVQCSQAQGCVCVSGTCESSPCGNPCNSVGDCALGCYCDSDTRLCLDCSKLSCFTEDCAQQLGCECVGGNCVGSSDTLYRCSPEVVTSLEGCIDVALVLDRTGSMRHFMNDLNSSANAFAQDVVSSGTGSRVGIVAFDTEVTLELPLTSTPNTIALTSGSCTNYTHALDKAVALLANSSACTKHIIFFTDGRQNTAYPGPFSGTGLSPSGANTSLCRAGENSLEDTFAVSIANVARSRGIEVRVVAYGAAFSGGQGHSLLTNIAGGTSNVYPAAINGASSAFNNIIGDIGVTVVEEAMCVPVDIDWTGEVYQTLTECEGVCGKKFYECTDSGCIESDSGTMTSDECLQSCNPTVTCDCAGGECTPVVGGSGVDSDCSNCIDSCSCNTVEVTLDYDCESNGVISSFVGGSGAGYVINLVNTTTGVSSTYNDAQMPGLQLVSGVYSWEVSDSGDASCSVSGSFTVSPCSCNTAGVTLTYDCTLNTVIGSFSGGTGSGYVLTIEDSSGSVVGTYTESQVASGIRLSADNYNWSAVDSGDENCVISGALNVFCCGTLKVSGTDVSSCTSDDAPLCFTVEDGIAPYTYIITDPNGNDVCNGQLPDFTVGTCANAACVDNATSTSSYSIEVTDANNCVVTSQLLVSVGEQLTLSASNLNGGCDDISFQELTFNVFGGVGPYQWSIIRGTALVVDNEITNSSIYNYTESSPANNTSYTVTVSEVEGCSETGTFFSTLDVCSDCRIDGSDVSICGNNLPQDVSAVISGGTAPYNWSITVNGDPNNPLNTFGTLATDGAIVFSDNIDTVHTLTFQAIDANEKVCSSSITVSVASYDPIRVGAGPAIICVGDTVTYTVSGGYPGGIFEFYENGIVLQSSTSPVFNGTMPSSGVLTICATSINDECVSEQVCNTTVVNCVDCDMEISEINTGVSQLGSAPNTCNGLSVSPSGCTSGITYTWVASNGGVIHIGQGTAQIVTNTVGTYTLTATCSGSTEECIIVREFTYPDCGLLDGVVDLELLPLPANNNILQVASTNNANNSHCFNTFDNGGYFLTVTASDGGSVLSIDDITAQFVTNGVGTYVATFTCRCQEQPCQEVMTYTYPAPCELVVDDIVVTVNHALFPYPSTCNTLSVPATGCECTTYTWTASNGGQIMNGQGTDTIGTNSNGTFTVVVECSCVDETCISVKEHTYDECIMVVESITPSFSDNNVLVYTYPFPTPTNCMTEVGGGGFDIQVTASDGGVVLDDNHNNANEILTNGEGTYTVRIWCICKEQPCETTLTYSYVEPCVITGLDKVQKCPGDDLVISLNSAQAPANCKVDVLVGGDPSHPNSGSVTVDASGNFNYTITHDDTNVYNIIFQFDDASNCGDCTGQDTYSVQVTPAVSCPCAVWAINTTRTEDPISGTERIETQGIITEGCAGGVLEYNFENPNTGFSSGWQSDNFVDYLSPCNPNWPTSGSQCDWTVSVRCADETTCINTINYIFI